MRVVFFGTPEFAATILTYLVENSVDVVAVVSRPDKAKGRSGTPQPTAVKLAAEKHHIPVYQPTKASDPEFTAQLQSLNADLFVVAAYAEILRENILEMPPLGCVNVHGSLLPKYRGAAPVQRAIMDGDDETGVCIMKMVLKMDAGDVYKRVTIPIPGDMSAGELFDVMAPVGAQALLDVMQQLEGEEIKAEPQDETAVTFAKKVSAAEGEIDWKKPAEHLHNAIRGLTPNPGAWCWVEVRGQKKRLRVKKARVERGLSGNPGEIFPLNGRLVVACGEGALGLLEVQLEGKKALPAEVFLQGVQVNNLKF